MKKQRKTRSDKGKKHNVHKWSFKREVNKQVTTLKKTIKQISKKYQADEVKRLTARFKEQLSSGKYTKRDINYLAKQHAEKFQQALTNKHEGAFSFLSDIHDMKLDKKNANYIMQFVDMNIGVTGESISREGNWNMRVIQAALDRTNNPNKLLGGLSPNEIQKLASYLVEENVIETEEDFLYQFLDEETSGLSNEDIMFYVEGYLSKANLENDLINNMRKGK